MADPIAHSLEEQKLSNVLYYFLLEIKNAGSYEGKPYFAV